MDKTQRIHAQADSDMSAHGSSKDKKAENTKENKKTQKKHSFHSNIKVRTFLVAVLTFIVVNAVVHLQLLNTENQEKLKATYTAESTIRRLGSQIDKYLSKTDMLKSMIESGYDIKEEEFNRLGDFLLDDDDVIGAVELAKDGVVNMVYPMAGNEAAIGLDMLNNPRRSREARLARESGNYTIAGPFELAQGGVGALLFDPIYVTGDQKDKEFWGFAILIVNWDRFIDETEISKLEDAGYHYQVWRKLDEEGQRTMIASCQDESLKNDIEVDCDVPNDTWYFDIVPVKGWVSGNQLLLGNVLCLVVALLIGLVYWQFAIRHRKEQSYMAEIEKTAENARLANEAKTRFLFNMSHDIRTPMNAIIGFAQLLKDHADDKDKVNEYTSKISASGSVLLSIINQVLEMARIESGEAELNEEVGNLRELTESIKAVFEPEISRKKLSCDYLVKVTEEFVSYDETKVREILLNIIGNSVKYTSDGGNISVRVEQISKGDQGSASYRFTVADTGIGMSEEYLPHIFEEFTRERTSTETRVEGTGLGLPIVKSLVDMMGGSIDVQSKVGVGTTTTIVLTFAVATNTEVLTSMDQSWENIADRLCGMRILMAEDNDLNAELAVTLLGERGILVDRAVDGVQCIEMLRSRPSDYYIAVLMDIQMPNMDGYQATEIIRGLGDARAKIPVIAMTANAFDEDKKKAFSAGMNGHVVKPVDLERIFTVLGDVLEVGKEIKN